MSQARLNCHHPNLGSVTVWDALPTISRGTGRGFPFSVVVITPITSK